MPRVTHFEICADDTERTVAFYRHVFGWQIRPWEGGDDVWVVVTDGDDADVAAINGSIVPAHAAPAGSVNLVDVPALDNALLRVVEAGGRILRGRGAIPGIGWVAYCADLEGNPFGLIQRDPAAA